MSDSKSRNAIFFLGAGASAHAGILTVRPMTMSFRAHLKTAAPDLSKTLDTLISALAKRQPEPDIEAILQTLHRLIDFNTDFLSTFLTDTSGLDRLALVKIKGSLEAFIRQETIKPSTVDYLSPLLDPVWGSPVDFFSVNYDTCIELLCRDLQRRLIDGFTPEWNPRSLETEEPNSVFLFKLHGSVLWYKSKKGWFIKVPIGAHGGDSESSELKLYDGDTATPMLLYPMFKQPMESPLLDFTYILKQRLESANFLIVIGYSFRDDYISALFRDAFRARPNLHMISIGPDARQTYLSLLKKGHSFESAFRNRVTCYPFPAEKILKRLAGDFLSFQTLIKKWQDYQSLTRIGRDAHCWDMVEPLSKVREPELSNFLLSTPNAAGQINLEQLWLVSFRNYAMALAMGDSDLIKSCYDQIHEFLAATWGMFNVQVSHTNGNWEIQCDLSRPGPNGTASSSWNFAPLLSGCQEAIKSVDEIRRDLHKDDNDKLSNLDKLREKLVQVHDFVKQFTAIHQMSHSVFRAIIRPQLLENTEQFDGWFGRLTNTPGNDSRRLGPEIVKICRLVLPRAFNDLLKAIEPLGHKAV